MPGAYTIDPTDLTRPLASDEVQYMADEIRALKSFVATELAAVGAPLPGWGKQTKNLFTNGDFKVWQRATSIATKNAFCADRWKTNSTGTGVFNASQTAGYASKYGISISDTVLATNQYLDLITAVEAVDSAPYAGQEVTLSFWAQSPSNEGTVEVLLGYPTVDNTFTVVEYPHNLVAQAVTNVDTKYTFTVTLAASAGGHTASKGLMAIIRYKPTTAGSRSIVISNVQFEYGPDATPFELIPVADTLLRCQRYYQSILDSHAGIDRGYNTATSVMQWLPFKVPMRAAPTVTKVGTWSVSNCSQPSVGAATINGIYWYTTVTVSGTYQIYPGAADRGFTASAELW